MLAKKAEIKGKAGMSLAIRTDVIPVLYVAATSVAFVVQSADIVALEFFVKYGPLHVKYAGGLGLIAAGFDQCILDQAFFGLFDAAAEATAESFDEEREGFASVSAKAG